MSKDTVNVRNKKGDWRPTEPIEPAPINTWPPDPDKVLKWLFGRPGYLWPENIFWLSITIATWFLFTPELSAMKNFELWWVAILFARNFVLVGLLCGGLHYLLYIRKKQGDELRFSTKPFPTNSGRFKFRHQVLDNMFHTLVSGVPIITAYEAITYWLFANNYIGFVDLTNPIVFWTWLVFLLLLSPIIHALHFYFGHRLLHVKYFYKHFHSLHHNNIQVGPWSGLSMHPVEHVIFFSTVMVQWLIALHPINALYQLQLAAFTPAPGHSGFEKVKVYKGVEIAGGSNFHYQHHKYFECNYGGSLMPLDKWFGTFHNGTKEATKRLHRQIRSRRKSNSTSK